jgi:polysaccharide export outer membrane protein
VTIKYSNATRVACLLLVATAMTACSLPRSGPNKSEIFAGSVQRQGDAFVVAVDDAVTRATAVVPTFGFGPEFLNAGVRGSDTISPGDTLGISIWENVEDGLLAGVGQAATTLEEVQVDGSGHIFVPYAGRIKASGKTPEQVRQTITDELSDQTPDPQVLVRRLAGDGATVSITGAIGGQGVYPIERPTRTLTAMLANAGGVSIDPDIAQVTIFRGSHQAKIWFNDLFRDPRYDIALRAGDRILVEGDPRTFTALGATGTQNRVPFESQAISAIEAIAQVGGLATNSADPTGIFVFRNEPADIANRVLGRNDLIGPQRMAYVLNLTEPNGVFIARDFVIRDGDTVYVTEAPFVQWSKTVNAALGTLSTLDTIDRLAN